MPSHHPQQAPALALSCSALSPLALSKADALSEAEAHRAYRPRAALAMAPPPPRGPRRRAVRPPASPDAVPLHPAAAPPSPSFSPSPHREFGSAGVGGPSTSALARVARGGSGRVGGSDGSGADDDDDDARYSPPTPAPLPGGLVQDGAGWSAGWGRRMDLHADNAAVGVYEQVARTVMPEEVTPAVARNVEIQRG